MSKTIADWMIVIGLLFDLIGTIGLVRLPDVYNRLQAATKCVTLGTCLILIGLLVLCAGVVRLTAPVGAHAIARGAHISGVRLWEESVSDAYLEDGQGARDAGEADAQTETP